MYLPQGCLTDPSRDHAKQRRSGRTPARLASRSATAAGCASAIFGRTTRGSPDTRQARARELRADTDQTAGMTRLEAISGKNAGSAKAAL